jgi:hypothetical protein
MKKKKFNFNNIKGMEGKKINSPQEHIINEEKKEWAKKNKDYVK